MKDLRSFQSRGHGRKKTQNMTMPDRNNARPATVHYLFSAFTVSHVVIIIRGTVKGFRKYTPHTRMGGYTDSKKRHVLHTNPHQKWMGRLGDISYGSELKNKIKKNYG